MIAEPTLEHCIYYLRHVEGDSSRAIQERRAAFEEELAALITHLERLSGRAIPAWKWPEESEERLASQLIVHTDWLDDPETGRSRLVAAGVYGDVYWFQVGYAQRGQARPEIFASLRDETWQPSTTEHLLGSSVYLCGIVAEEENEVIAPALAAYLGDSPGAVLTTRLANGRAGLYGSFESPYVTVLFYPDAECEDWVGEHITSNIAPRLELYKHKIDRQLAWCEANFPILSEQEQLLRGLLQESARLLLAKASPKNVECLQELIQLHCVFDGNVGMLTDRQVTIGINLQNLDVVLEELEPLAEDHLLSAVRDRLRGRHEQLEADLTYADQPRQQAERTINALKVELALERRIDRRARPGDAGFIERGGFPGALPTAESEIDPPQVKALPSIPLTEQEEMLLRRVYLGYKQVQVEKEFGSGYGDARVLLTLPITTRDRKAALTVTKLGPVHELCAERENYERYVEPHLPFCVAPLKGGRYYERGNQAVLNYAYVGEGSLGRVMDLEAYYRRAASSRAVTPIVELLDDLLDRELGQHWYDQTDQQDLSFAAEYGQHIVEHVRLRLRPASSDGFWPAEQPPVANADYRRIEVDAILDEYEEIQPGKPGEPPTLLSVEGLVVLRIKRDQVKLTDPSGQGIFVRVEFAPDNDAVQGLEVGNRVGVRGEVVYNRRDRMEQVVCSAFPDLSPGVGSRYIELPGVSGTYPNPLEVYPQVLGRMLQDRWHSYVHGDLHLRNVLVDEGGRGWLIDFARASERHNLFDFVKLETYVRLMGLGAGDLDFSLNDYVRFEKALAAATLEEPGKESFRRLSATIRRLFWRRTTNRRLAAAYDMILAIRRIARKYMAPGSSFSSEYFPALFLYCLAVTKYYQEDTPQPTRLLFATAAVLGCYLGSLEEKPL